MVAGESLGFVSVEVRADTAAARAELAKFNSDIKRMGTAAGGASAMSAAAVSGRTGIGAWAAAASSKVLSLSSSLNRVSRSMGTAGRTLAWRSAWVGLLGASAVKAANTFEMTFAKIEGLAGKIGVSMDEAKQKVKDLAIAFGRDPQELAEGLYFIASAGVRAKDAMSVLEQSAKGAAAQMADTQTLAQMLTTVMNNYGKSGMTAAGALEILKKAIELGKAEPQEFADSLGPVIPMASQLGVSFASMAGAIAQGTNAGLSAARAATGLRFILGSLQKVTPQAKDVLKEYGLTVEDLQGKFKELGATGGIQYLSQLFDTTTTKGKEAFAILMGGQRGLIIANALIGENFERAKRIDEGMKGALGSGGVNDALAKTQQTQAQRFRELTAQWQVFKIELGEEIVPLLLERVLPAVRAILDAFSDLSDVWKQRIIMGGLFTVLMGPAMMFLGVVTKIAAGLVWIGGKGLGILAGRGVMAAAAAASGGVVPAVGPATVGSLGWPVPSATAAAGGGAAAAGAGAAIGASAWGAGIFALLTTIAAAVVAIKIRNFNNKNEADAVVADIRGSNLSIGQLFPGKELFDPDVIRGLQQYRQEQEKIVRAAGIASAGTETWAKTLVKKNGLTVEETQLLVNKIDQLDRENINLGKNRRKQIENLIRMGDVNRALDTMNDWLGNVTTALANFKGVIGSISYLQGKGKAAPTGTGGIRINPGSLAEHGAITGLAGGGYLVTQPTFIRGDVLTGEKRKKEAVIPLEDVRGKRILAGAMAEAMGTASGGTVVVNVAGKVERPEDIRRELDWWMRSRGL